MGSEGRWTLGREVSLGGLDSSLKHPRRFPLSLRHWPAASKASSGRSRKGLLPHGHTKPIARLTESLEGQEGMCSRPHVQKHGR